MVQYCVSVLGWGLRTAAGMVRDVSCGVAKDDTMTIEEMLWRGCMSRCHDKVLYCAISTKGKCATRDKSYLIHLKLKEHFSFNVQARTSS